MALLQYWKEFLTIITFITGIIIGHGMRKARTKKEQAIANQEEVKVKREEADLSQTFQTMYDKFLEHDRYRTELLEKKIEKVEYANKDLEDKYNEILLRNAILEERATSYEEKYNQLYKEHTKLKEDNTKLHKENIEIRKELNELKNKQNEN